MGLPGWPQVTAEGRSAQDEEAEDERQRKGRKRKGSDRGWRGAKMRVPEGRGRG